LLGGAGGRGGGRSVDRHALCVAELVAAGDHDAFAFLQPGDDLHVAQAAGAGLDGRAIARSAGQSRRALEKKFRAATGRWRAEVRNA